MQVFRYIPEIEEEWNDFVATAKNATFFFNRNYLDYHSERFTDYSLIIRDRQGKITAALPCNYLGEGTVMSHNGLTFGGLIVGREDKLLDILSYFKVLLEYLCLNEVTTLRYKEIPAFYNDVPSDEQQYALFLLEARLYRRDTAITINQNSPLPFQKRRLRSIKAAEKNGVQVKEVQEFNGYWKDILEPNLLARFGVQPVHSLDEIELLYNRFPQNIRQFNAYLDGQIMAGTTVFETPQVAHAQYISASDEGRKNGSLDFLFFKLIKDIFSYKSYFDFGICNEEAGRVVNKGLLEWKEGFGGRTYSHNFYEITTANFNKLIDITY